MGLGANSIPSSFELKLVILIINFVSSLKCLSQFKHGLYIDYQSANGSSVLNILS